TTTSASPSPARAPPSPRAWNAWRRCWRTSRHPSTIGCGSRGPPTAADPPTPMEVNRMTRMSRGSRRSLQTLLAAGALALTAISAAQAATPPTVEEARKFIEGAEERLRVLSIDEQRASWVQSTFITPDTEVIAAQATEALTAAGVEYAKGAARFDGVQLPADLRRRMNL